MRIGLIRRHLAGLDPDKKEVWCAWEFEPLENSAKILGVLLELYWQGLTRPLLFFPNTSWKYAQLKIEKNRKRKKFTTNAK